MSNCNYCIHAEWKKLGPKELSSEKIFWCPKRGKRISRGMQQMECNLYTPYLAIISCVGNEKIFNVRLGACLKSEVGRYQLIKLPTNKPMPETFNSLNLDQIQAEYLMFVHEDVYFMNKNWIKKIIRLCRKIPNLGIAGVAGVREKGGGSNTVGYILHWGSRGMKRKRGFGHPRFDGKVVEVQTLDAQVLIVPMKIFKEIKFSNDFPFHMMAEDYCLTLKYIHKKSVVVLPLKIWHNEGGFSRKKVHVNLQHWHDKLYDKWTPIIKRPIYVTSRATGLKTSQSKAHKYCPKCGGDVDTLTTHIPNSKYKYECRMCKYKWGKP